MASEKVPPPKEKLLDCTPWSLSVRTDLRIWWSRYWLMMLSLMK